MTAYEIAIEAHNQAIAKYEAASKTFMAGGSFDDFAAAKADKKAADDAFDVAFEIASNLPNEDDDIFEGDVQADLFT